MGDKAEITTLGGRSNQSIGSIEPSSQGHARDKALLGVAQIDAIESLPNIANSLQIPLVELPGQSCDAPNHALVPYASF